MYSYIFQLLTLATLTHATSTPKCKAVPGTKDWPSNRDWAHLNDTISGRLLKPSPPGAVCHSDQPTYNAATCPSVQAGWLTAGWHTLNPVSAIENEWNNDTCLPFTGDPCSGKGYPLYVINATSAQDVKKGVDFARKENVRLIVKGTGHDYLGRSSAPNNTLSIWTHYITGINFHGSSFTPQGCPRSFTPIKTHAITAGSGTQMLDLNYAAHLRNLTIVSGGSGTVGLGGYLTGGGHSALSSTYGLASDQVMEMEVVTPTGDIVIANECQNQDLFWAMRGGGGSTFGVMTSVTIKSYPSSEWYTLEAWMGVAVELGDTFWDVIASLLSQYPALDAQGISGYMTIAPGINGTAVDPRLPPIVNSYYGLLFIPKTSPLNTSDSLTAAVGTWLNNTLSKLPTGTYFSQLTPASYPDFYAWFEPNNGPRDGNHNEALGGRLLDEKALTSNLTAVAEAFKTACPVGTYSDAYVIGGKAVRNAMPRGGSSAVNPAWRRAFGDTIFIVNYPPLDPIEKARQETILNGTYIEAMRKLAPDMGSYMNEGFHGEPNWQQAFFGENYPRLAKIKKQVDPDDVFVCFPCVGSERWELIDNVLCKV